MYIFNISPRIYGNSVRTTRVRKLQLTQQDRRACSQILQGVYIETKNKKQKTFIKHNNHIFNKEGKYSYSPSTKVMYIPSFLHQWAHISY